ncbi:glycosyltransferase family 4 protein [Cohnella lubricantis]|uniref:Glycosyltransferase family 4 protein n=1 Tax=Cohnella lubricantis TaxID=2163172 RepID=A0A841TCY7_9BACL|nr:glycosyltransferase family 4 protein [Cohnella lubricantis]MBB6676837.1 glycosyltransferase family 4 protein [Cohnella lubricantis]MBP2119417.1 glycosyltransferase involved in cell wall biosynthesis [Cohnella lubricantis]
MRIAWIGPMPNNDGGATGVGRHLLLELSNQGVEVDCFFFGKPDNVPPELIERQNLRVICQPSSWKWNKWYSRNNYMAFVTGQIANLRCEMKLAERIVEEHRKKPYDYVYQFSHIEMHALLKHKASLPPIVLHPSVHAAGELRWHRLESRLARHSEGILTRAGVRLLLMMRASVQKRHARSADHILSLSRSFADEMIEDYKLDSAKVRHIVPNPIDLEKFVPKQGQEGKRRDSRITFLFASRISVRKGTEMIVELSHRLQDLAGQVRILIVGNHSLWSDYRGLLKNINPEIATYLGRVSGKEMDALYASVDALIQPAHYEPFGLTVAEALATGIPVIASDKIGAAEGVDKTVCRIFRAGDIDALERLTRQLAEELATPKREELAAIARSEAKRLYSGETIVSNLISILGGRKESAIGYDR